MKKIISLVAIAFVALGATAQNVQFHHDFGRSMYSDEEGNRPQFTATYELFKADKWGSTYYFIDVDLYKKGVAGAYTEISREINLGKKSPFAAHIEYDGGLTTGKYDAYSSQFQHAVLIGPAWNWASADYSKTFSVQAMYKQYFAGNSRKAYSSWQLTEVWGINFAHNYLTFSGFADLWYDQTVDGNLIFITEPQFWFNLNALPKMEGVNLSIGTEWEVSNNFIYNTVNHKTMFVNPTIALKWTF